MWKITKAGLRTAFRKVWLLGVIVIVCLVAFSCSQTGRKCIHLITGGEAHKATAVATATATPTAKAATKSQEFTPAQQAFVDDIVNNTSNTVKQYQKKAEQAEQEAKKARAEAEQAKQQLAEAKKTAAAQQPATAALPPAAAAAIGAQKEVIDQAKEMQGQNSLRNEFNELKDMIDKLSRKQEANTLPPLASSSAPTTPTASATPATAGATDPVLMKAMEKSDNSCISVVATGAASVLCTAAYLQSQTQATQQNAGQNDLAGQNSVPFSPAPRIGVPQAPHENQMASAWNKQARLRKAWDAYQEAVVENDQAKRTAFGSASRNGYNSYSAANARDNVTLRAAAVQEAAAEYQSILSEK